MNAGIIARAAAVWLALLVLAVLNGGAREKLLVPALGHFGGLVASGLVLSALIFGVSYLAMGWIGATGPAQYWVIGAGWLAATLLFEVSFGHIVAGKSWRELSAVYSFEGGNLWPVVLAVIALSPRICARLRGLA